MRSNKVAIYLIALLFIGGCAQTQLPPPYPTGGAEPSTTDITTQPMDQAAAEEAPEPQDQQREPGIIGEQAGAGTSFPEMGGALISEDFVNDRLNYFNTQLERLKELDAASDITKLDPQQTRDLFTCSRDLQRLLDGYQGFRIKFSEGSPGLDNRSVYEPMLALQRLDIEYLSGSCAIMLGGDRASAGGLFPSGSAEAVLIQAETTINERFQAGAYEDVIQIWSQLTADQQDQADVKSALQYADALMYTDQPARSAEVYQRVIDRIAGSDSRSSDLLTIRKRLADLQTAAGNLYEAERQYELIMQEYAQAGAVENWARQHVSLLGQSAKGSAELGDYTRLLRAYLSFAPAEDGYSIVWEAEKFLQRYPYSPVADIVDLIKTDSAERADQWFSSLIAQADELVSQKQLRQAIELLESVPDDKLGPENLNLLKGKQDDLMLAEAVERETAKIEKMQELQRIWNEGIVHAEAGEVDQAIGVLSQLTGTEYEDRAQEKIRELAGTASMAERRKAADLFVRATKTDDLEARKQLLIESRSVLKGILAKYPDVEVAEKVKGNIRQVEKKISEIDPMLLEQLELQELDQQTLRAPAGTDQKIEGFDVDTPPSSSVNQPKKAVLPVYTPQSMP
jgi:hypothetical protein